MKKDTDVYIDRCFVVVGEPLYFGPAVTGAITNSYFYGPDGYTPPLFRRRRLKRFAPLVRRAKTTKRLWDWLG